MTRAAFALLFTLALGADVVSVTPEWPNAALTDSEGRILGTFHRTPPEQEGDPVFGTGIWADTAAKSPDKPRAVMGLGVSLHKRGEWLQSQRRFEEASAAYQKAAEQYQRVIALPSDSEGFYRLEAQMNLAGLYATVNEFGEAEALVQSVLLERPDHMPAIVKLAYIRLFIASIATQQGRSDDAHVAYRATLDATDMGLNRRVFDHGLSFGTLFSYRAQAHAALGDCEAANKEFEFAHQQDPDIPLRRCEIAKGD